jgi:hypothetical protein
MINLGPNLEQYFLPVQPIATFFTAAYVALIVVSQLLPVVHACMKRVKEARNALLIGKIQK